jgi:hypothetical protein
MSQRDLLTLFNATDQSVSPLARMHLAFITRHWLTIATLAWEGYTQSGRGAVVIAPGTRSDADADESRMGYLPDTLVQQHGGWSHPHMPDYLRASDPLVGVVVIVQAGSDGEAIYYVAHTPSPPDAARQWHRTQQEGDQVA